MPKYIGVKGPLDGVVIFPLSRLVGRHGRPGRLRPRAARSALRRAAFRASSAAIVAGRPPPWLPARRAPKRFAMAGRGAADGRGGKATGGPFRTKMPTDSPAGMAYFGT